MNRSTIGRALLGVLILLTVILAWRAGSRFPWDDLTRSFTEADTLLLLATAAVALFALAVKGWAWHLLLRPVAPHRMRVAMEANLIGSAVNYISVAVIGEAARVRFLVAREPVTTAQGVASVVWARAVEGLGLAVFILAGGLLLPLPPLVRGAQLVALGIVAGTIVVFMARGRASLPSWVPAPVRTMLGTFANIGSWRRVVLPFFLALVNWGAQWATYHLALVATGIPASPAASFTATLASNIGGALRLTPGNVGITQATVAMALLPFGIQPAPAIAASVVLQALQVLPTLALALGIVGWRGLGQMKTRAAEAD